MKKLKQIELCNDLAQTMEEELEILRLKINEIIENLKNE